MESAGVFVDVILPVNIPGKFTYSVSSILLEKIGVGKRVVVEFGKRKQHSAIIYHIHRQEPAYDIKPIIDVLDETPLVYPVNFEFWDWICGYYLCNPGDVLNAALPAALKIHSETKVVLKDSEKVFDSEDFLTASEYLVWEALDYKKVLKVSEISSLLEGKNPHRIINQLLKKGVILLEEEIKEVYKPKMEKFLSLEIGLKEDSNKLQAMFTLLEKAPKQSDALLCFLHFISKVKDENGFLSKSVLIRELGQKYASAVKSLIEKNILIEQEEEVSRLTSGLVPASGRMGNLSSYQKEKLAEIQQGFSAHKPVLLHGVTSSGKTELYMNLIEEKLREKKQSLFLLPEISLTAQMIQRLTRRFGEQVAVYHSKLSSQERVEIWKNIAENDSIKVVLGARSSIFLPFTNLGLIIVDEEHESSFKQFDPAPRYHARDAALVLAQLFKADVILGSATPSIESYQNAVSGKFHLVEMNKRFGNVEMPDIVVSDMADAHKRKLVKSIFGPELFSSIGEALEKKEQVILFQNRRGFSPFLQCNSCGWIPYCRNCDVSLTYHKAANILKCHYCGYIEKTPKNCLACESAHLKTMGLGTEKIEEEVELLFPGVAVKRMDFDSTRGKNSFQMLIDDFDLGKIQILVGTQMVTKGLDFHNVSLVGVLNADNLLNFPDFRAFERSYQLMAQVSGRAGRRDKKGKVIVQTHTPSHHIIKQVKENDYLGMFNTEMEDRRNFIYPPYARLVLLSFKHQDKDKVFESAHTLAERLKEKVSARFLGPEFPAISRVRNLYVMQLMLKLPKDKTLPEQKLKIKRECDWLLAEKGNSQLRINIDVDPA